MIVSEFQAEEGDPGREAWTVADLFSCGGGTSAGFSRRPAFRLVGAVDYELAKPSGGAGVSECNATYEANHGIAPLNEDLMTFPPEAFSAATGVVPGQLDVLISCAPCTNLSRANPNNHVEDSPLNGLVGRSGDYAAYLLPDIMFMENARELIHGNFSHHHASLCVRLRALGYDVKSDVHILTEFGLPQVRERALVVASRIGEARTLEDLWSGWRVKRDATTVRVALSRLQEWRSKQLVPDMDGMASPGMGGAVLDRLRATPHDGGSWLDLAKDPEKRHLLPAACLTRWRAGRLGSHPDVYGRMWWDRPAPTIKRECAHVGNGRYAHPEEDRLMTVREMAALQGFPFDYRFPSKSLANRYRHIGDAVPPLIAWQIAALAMWMKTGNKPEPSELVLPTSTLRGDDIVRC